jgi:putative glutathione S-transferase
MTSEFIRPPTTFRSWIRADGSTPFKPEAGRYHLYVSLACPWAHRTLIIRSMRKLEDLISVSITDPVWNESGWTFSNYPGSTLDELNHCRDLIDLYRLADPGFQGEESTPVLWDKKLKTIVNNESAEILRMMDQEFRGWGDPSVDLYPEPLRGRIDETIRALYHPINNGVYRAGFARTQAAYDRAVLGLFEALDYWEAVLSSQRYLCGNVATEADICLFTTLFRFDPVYVTHFKCNIRRIADYHNLSHYLRDLFQLPAIRSTCNLDHIKRHYYLSHRDINPRGIIPLGPELDLDSAHDRDKFNEKLVA